LNLLFACCEAECRKADSKIEGWEQSKQTKEGVPKRALQAGSAVSTSVGSEMAQGVDRPTPTAASPQKRRATERQARVCGPSAARKADTGAAQQWFANLREGDYGANEKEIMVPMSTSALMFFNCCQRACETCTSKATPIMIGGSIVAST